MTTLVSTILLMLKELMVFYFASDYWRGSNLYMLVLYSSFLPFLAGPMVKQTIQLGIKEAVLVNGFYWFELRN